jgi:hypothetical protein
MSSPASRPPYRALDATIAQNERRKPRRLTGFLAPDRDDPAAAPAPGPRAAVE